jgi:hypothetical protein
MCTIPLKALLLLGPFNLGLLAKFGFDGHPWAYHLFDLIASYLLVVASSLPWPLLCLWDDDFFRV